MTPEETRAQMVSEWGLSDFPKEKQDEFIDRIGEILFQRIVLRATGEMDDAALTELDAFMEKQGDSGDTAAAIGYLNSHVGNFDQIVQEETAELKKLVALPA